MGSVSLLSLQRDAKTFRKSGRILEKKRSANRLTPHRDHLLTFLHQPEVPADNNFDERQIRPVVMIRKISQGNRSDNGAAAQGILMSIYRTLYLRDLNPTETIAAALRTYLITDQLPPLPDAPIAHG